MKTESLKLAKDVYKIEMECIKEMEEYFDETSFAKAVEILKNAERQAMQADSTATILLTG